MSPQALKQEYAASIFTVSGVGTAYLIDSKNGYLVTASHVLDDVAKAKKPSQVWVAMPDSPKHKSFAFKVSKRNVDLDVALLKIPDPVPLVIQQLRSLDIASVVPDVDTTLFAMGYPIYGPQAEVFLRSGNARFNSVTPGGMLEVEQLAEGGNSGGPLLDSSGYVIATCEQETEQNKIGRYLPMVQTLSLFEDMPVSDRMLEIERALSGKTIDDGELKRVLAHSSTSPTNLELYLWVKRVAASPDLMALIRPRLKCPIIPALSERGMLDALYLFFPLAQTPEQAYMSAILGDREYRLGHDSTALEYAKSAVALASPEQTETRLNALLLQGKSEERMNLVVEAKKSYSEGVRLASDRVADASIEADARRSRVNLWARTVTAEANVTAKMGDGTEAYTLFGQAENLYQLNGDKRGQYDTRFDVARLRLRSNDFVKAEQSLREAIEVAPDDALKADAWYQLGVVQLQRGDEEGAIASFTRVASLAPKTPQGTDARHVIDLASAPKGIDAAQPN